MVSIFIGYKDATSYLSTSMAPQTAIEFTITMFLRCRNKYYFYPMKKYTFILFIIVGLIACGTKEISIKKYYFPYASFIKPQIYQYVERKDSSSVMYWYFKTMVEKGDTLLTTYIFDSNFQLKNIYQNTITSEGCILKEMFINMGDSTIMTQCLVEENEVFRWKIKPTEKLMVSFGISNASGDELENVITERSFEPKIELIKFNEKKYECLIAKDFILLNHIKTNRTASEEQHRTSFFAKGIGLIEFETFYANGSSTYFSLKKIISEEEWSKMTLGTPD